MTKTIWGDQWEVTREKTHGKNTIENLSWCLASYGSDKTILILDQILLEDDLSYLLDTFQTSHSTSVLKKETYVPVKGLDLDHIEDILYDAFGV
jgi:hypothetical protein